MFLFLECLLEKLEMLEMIPEMIDLCSMRAFCRAFNDLCCQWRRPLVHRSLCTAGSSTAAPALAAAVQLLHHSQILEADDSKRETYPGPDDSKHKPMITLKNPSHLIKLEFDDSPIYSSILSLQYIGDSTDTITIVMYCDIYIYVYYIRINWLYNILIYITHLLEIANVS